MLKELIHSKHRHCAELVQAEHSIPELIVPPKHEHDSVALFDAEGLEVIRRLRRSLFDILEAETALLLIGGYVEQGELVGRFIGNGVDDIVGEVEFVGVFEFYLGRRAVIVLGNVDEFSIDPVLAVSVSGLRREPLRLLKLGYRLARGVQDYGVKQAVAAVDGYHSVGSAAVVINAVAGAEHRLVLADLHHQLALDYQVAFLTCVGGELDITVLRLLAVNAANEQRLGYPVFEGSREVIIGHAVSLLYLLPLSAAGEDIGFQLRAVTLDNVGNVNAEGEGAAVNECKRQVAAARFAGYVFLLGDVGLLRHLCGRERLDLAQLLDASRHFFDLVIKSRDFLHYNCPFLFGASKKARPKADML